MSEWYYPDEDPIPYDMKFDHLATGSSDVGAHPTAAHVRRMKGLGAKIRIPYFMQLKFFRWVFYDGVGTTDEREIHIHPEEDDYLIRKLHEEGTV